jgi:hypothetical protein
MNQCDGCRVGAPYFSSTHRLLAGSLNHQMPDGGFMGCTKHLYDSPVAMPTEYVHPDIIDDKIQRRLEESLEEDNNASVQDSSDGS